MVGVDIARNLVAAGNARAREQGLTNLTFREGDSPPPPEGFVSPMAWGIEDSVIERPS